MMQIKDAITRKERFGETVSHPKNIQLCQSVRLEGIIAYNTSNEGSRFVLSDEKGSSYYLVGNRKIIDLFKSHLWKQVLIYGVLNKMANFIEVSHLEVISTEDEEDIFLNNPLNSDDDIKGLLEHIGKGDPIQTDY